MLLGKLLDRLIQKGTLNVIDAFGKTHTFGCGEAPRSTIRFHDPALHWKLFFNPLLYTGEAYMEGTLTIEDGSLYDFLALVGMNRVHKCPHPLSRVTLIIDRMLRRFHQFNPIKKSQKNVAHHYDLSGKFYELFLDTDRQYSCAYYQTGMESLDIAQEKKKRHIAAKLAVEPGQRVLDIGSGWGGLALYLAKNTNCYVTGLTLSNEQLNYAVPRTVNQGLSNRIQFHLRDYREQTGTFDRIVSVGMFEHVGVDHFHDFFGKIHELLSENGIAVLHTIGRTDGPGSTNPWIRKFIFPGGYIPALSEIVRSLEKAGLIITDIEILRLHYAETLRHWRERFLQNWQKAAELYDERFCRMWEFYLAGSEASFRYMDNVVFQIQIAKKQDSAPLTRDYITDKDRESESQLHPQVGSRAA